MRGFFRLLFPLAFLFAGCDTSQPIFGRKAEPAPVIASVSDSASDGMSALSEAWAKEADTTAKTAKNFKDWQSAFEDWQRRNIAANKRVFGPYANSLNQACLGPPVKGKWNLEAPYDPAKLEAAAKEAAAGYRRTGQ